MKAKAPAILFGVAVGLWFGSWLAWLSPAVPFLLAYPFGFWAMWEISKPHP